jgi:hypothetical protein
MNDWRQHLVDSVWKRRAEAAEAKLAAGTRGKRADCAEDGMIDEDRRQEREREGRIEGAIRLSERARIVAWLRTFAPIAEGRDVGALVDAIERGEHWRETL